MYEFMPILSTSGIFEPVGLSSPPSLEKNIRVSLFCFVHFETSFSQTVLNTLSDFLQVSVPRHSRMENTNISKQTPQTLSARWWGNFYKHLEVLLNENRRHGLIVISDPLRYSCLLALFHTESAGHSVDFLNIAFWTYSDYPTILDTWVKFFSVQILDQVSNKFLTNLKLDQNEPETNVPETLKRKRDEILQDTEKKQKLDDDEKTQVLSEEDEEDEDDEEEEGSS
jgi:hypothetical protein